MKVEFTIPGMIRGKGRHRTFMHDSKGNQLRDAQGRPFMRTAPDEKTVQCEALVRDFASRAMRDAGAAPFLGPVFVRIFVWKMPPKSWSEKKRRAVKYVTGRPDCDNVLKLVKDAVKGIVWRDDSQVAKFSFERQYRQHDQECTILAFEELGGSEETML